MYPSKNMDEFLGANASGAIPLFDKDDYLDNIYICFIQSRINTNLLLINNPNLIEQFGLNLDEIVNETKKLFEISSYIKIPDTVPERKNRKIFR